MKFKREDFKLYDASYNDDWTQVWIKRRKFKRKFILLGDEIPTPDFELVLDGIEPLEFSSIDEAEQYIKEQIGE